MPIEPVKKINGVEENKNVAYYNKRGYKDNFKESFEEKEKEKEEKEEKSEIELEENVQETSERKNSNSQMIYNLESSKSKNSKVYRGLTSDEAIPELQKNEGLQFLKAMKAYNKTNRRKNKRKNEEQKEKQEDITTKKQEMEEFKKSCQAEINLNLACENFNKALKEKEQEEIKKKRRGYVYRKHDER